MQLYKKKDILQIVSKEGFVKNLKCFADRELPHLFSLTEEQISQVLTTLSCYCEQKGSNTTNQIYKDILLQMVQYQDDACGHRFEIWAM